MVQGFTIEDIKNAVFDIGNEKSLEPDGYTSYLFKKSWSVVGGDLCEAVLEFFRYGQLIKQVITMLLLLSPKRSMLSMLGISDRFPAVTFSIRLSQNFWLPG